jgi:hypothetical protein
MPPSWTLVVTETPVPVGLRGASGRVRSDEVSLDLGLSAAVDLDADAVSRYDVAVRHVVVSDRVRRGAVNPDADGVPRRPLSRRERPDPAPGDEAATRGIQMDRVLEAVQHQPADAGRRHR